MNNNKKQVQKNVFLKFHFPKQLKYKYLKENDKYNISTETFSFNKKNGPVPIEHKFKINSSLWFIYQLPKTLTNKSTMKLELINENIPIDENDIKKIIFHCKNELQNTEIISENEFKNQLPFNDNNLQNTILIEKNEFQNTIPYNELQNTIPYNELQNTIPYNDLQSTIPYNDLQSTIPIEENEYQNTIPLDNNDSQHIIFQNNIKISNNLSQNTSNKLTTFIKPNNMLTENNNNLKSIESVNSFSQITQTQNYEGSFVATQEYVETNTQEYIQNDNENNIPSEVNKYYSDDDEEIAPPSGSEYEDSFEYSLNNINSTSYSTSTKDLKLLNPLNKENINNK
eukprot:jgi/Orpsp1_1/1178575/evm.model.c7180000065898.2